MGKLINVKINREMKPLYDIEVKDNHNFVVNGGVVVKNSEQYLSRSSLCVLGSINVEKFSLNKNEYIWQLEKISKSINRFLDNVNECELLNETYATPHQRIAIKKLRRTGAGVTNISAWLFKLGLEYGSDEANIAIEDFIKWYNYWLYVSSEENGKEKGNFELFNENKWKSAPFVDRVIKESKKLNKEYGVPILTGESARNVTVSSIAPTGCIDENTRISTNRGLIKIKDLLRNIPDEKTFLYDIPTTQVSTPYGNQFISAFYNNGNVKGYVLEFEDGRTLKISDTHRIKVLKNGIISWEYAPNLKIGDIAILIKDHSIEPENYVSLNTLKSSDPYNLSECTLPETLNEKLAEWIGIFTGDGSITFRSENKKVDEVRFPVYVGDRDLMDYIIRITKELFGLECKCSKHENKEMYEVYIHSLNLGNFLINNGLSKKDVCTDVENCKTHIYHIPELIFRSPKNVICAYLRGLFEADGTISNGQIELMSKFKHLVQEVQELLTYVGIQSYISKVDKTKSGGFNDEMYRVYIRFKSDKLIFREKIGFLSNRKNNLLVSSNYEIDREKIYLSLNDCKKYREKLVKIISSKSPIYSRLSAAMRSNCSNGIVFLNRDLLSEIGTFIELDFPFDLNKMFYLKIKNISRENIRTFDIEVSDNHHSYITSNGIINHNTLSLQFRGSVMSYGVEPAFFMYYWKRTRMSGKYEYYFCVPGIVRKKFKELGISLPIESDTILDTWDGKYGKPVAKIIDENKHLFKFKESVEVSPFEKLELMSKIMKWVDSSISVTYMLPIGSTWNDVYDFILKAYEKEIKSIAAFPDKKMYGIVSNISFKELAFKLKSEDVYMHSQNFSDEELKELNLSRELIVSTSSVPKRLNSLDAHIYTVSVKGEKFVIVVGIQNGQPYEIFGGHLNGLGIKQQFKEGKIIKVKRGQYALEFDDIFIEDFSKQFTPTEQILFRMASLSMRHGVPIDIVVQQLQRATDDITSMASAAARVLKKYITNGQRVAGQQCPTCGSSELIYVDGCVSCNCGWNKCS
jgi:ribonucleoside-diphosphate reductase alpha chain